MDSCHCYRRTSLIAVTVVLILGTVFRLWRRTKRTFEANVAKVAHLYVYPIKSVPGIEVEKATITRDGGLEYKNILKDRCMVLLNSQKRMITMRHDARLALIQTSLLPDGPDKFKLQFEAPGMDAPLVIHLYEDETEARKSPQVIHDFTIWSTATQGIEVSPQASKWFSVFLNQEGVLLLKHLPSHKKRPTVIETPSGDKKIASEIPIDYQDGSPILLTNIESLKSLNESIPADSSLAPFEVRNFRPNIVIDKIPSSKEEDFLFVRFSNAVVCKNIKLCDRCAVPTIDQNKGVKEDERHGILQRFRSANNSREEKLYGKNALFGINLAPESSGDVEVGSWIDVSYKTNDG